MRWYHVVAFLFFAASIYEAWSTGASNAEWLRMSAQERHDAENARTFFSGLCLLIGVALVAWNEFFAAVDRDIESVKRR